MVQQLQAEDRKYVAGKEIMLGYISVQANKTRARRVAQQIEDLQIVAMNCEHVYLKDQACIFQISFV